MRVVRLMVCLVLATPAFAATPQPTQFVLNAWDTSSGLPEETINSIAQTPDGFLWLANANGLVRYDGSSFRTYQPRQDLGGGVRQDITRMGSAQDNSVWLHSRNLGLVRFRQGVFRRAPELPPCSVTDIQEDRNGVLLICAERVLLISGEQVRELTEVPLESANRIQAATRDSDGFLWIGWSDGAVTRLGGPDASPVSYRVPAAVTTIVPAGSGRLWVGSRAGLALVEAGRVKVFTTADGLPSNHIRKLTLSRDGFLWIGTTKGVAFQRDGKIELISTLPAGWVTSLIEDREDNIWIAFTDLNLYRLRKPKFLTWGEPEGLPRDRPLAVTAAGDATWIAIGGGLWRLAAGELRRIPVPNEDVRFLEKAGDGRVWVQTEQQLYILEPATSRLRRVDLPVPVSMCTLNPDRAGRMWIVTRTGLFVSDKDAVKPVPMEGLPALTGRTDLRQTSDGRLWLSINKLGLFELRDGKATPVSLGADPELKRIFTSYIDSNDDFWFGLDGGGLARWRKGRLARYGNKIGQPHNFVYHLGEDSEGYLWLGLRSGLVRLGKAELNAFLDGTSAAAPRENYFDIDDGLRSFNFGGANRTLSSLTAGPVLWFPSLTGVVRIDARNIPFNRMIPPVHMEEVSADQSLMPLGESVAVPAGADILRFVFSVPTLVGHNRMQIRYRLEPFDTNWRGTGGRAVTYSRVPPGEYTFSVKASNNDGVWNERGTSFKVAVAPQFYQTWWFLFLALVLVASGIAGVFRWRTMLLRREKEKLEQRVDQRTAELSEAMRVANTAAQAKADFLATMSHEIRTPMHGVLGTLELLSETGLNGQQSEYLSTARNSSHSMLSLLNDILDLSKMEAGRMDLHPAPFCLQQTIVEVTRLLQAQARVQGITLSVNYSQDLPGFFEGDEMRIRQIIFNLAGNAVKFTTAGEVTIDVSGQEQPGSQWSLAIAVRDTGIGIPQDRIPQLFEDFFQVQSAANRRFAGSGLGLAICQRLARMMAGSITVSSELGRGSTFSLLLQLPAASAGSRPSQSASQISANQSFHAEVLLAEDNRVNQKLATEMLTRLGCTVTLAQNGREAVELARHGRFSLILMDCQMPEMDGFEAARLIRSELGGETVIVALTANSLPGDRERCLEAGMNDYLAKPFGRADLVRLLEQYLPIPK